MVCNSGVRVTPLVDGETHHFAEHGLYDGLFLMRDEESGTFWDHLTGEAVYGPLVGKTLEIQGLEYSLAGQVLENHPEAVITFSDQVLRKNDDLELDGLLERTQDRLSGMFSSTIASEDDRLPTMDLGIGIWSENSSRYYSYTDVLDAGNALLDEFDGRHVLIFLDPDVQVLSAMYVDAEGLHWEDEVLHLSNGQTISNSILHGQEDQPVQANRPLQVFTRWYGFALTFPGTEIYKK